MLRSAGVGTRSRARGPAPTSVLSRRHLCRGGLLALGLGATVPLSALLGACSDGGSSDDAATRDDPGSDSAGGDGAEDVGTEGPVMYASPTCGCCAEYASYLQSNGHDVEVEHVDDLPAIKSRYGIPAEAESCHTTLLEGYVVEGHVPVEAIDKLLAERPQIDAIALPEMPAGSPGMPGPKTSPFEILAITGGTTSPYVTL